MSSILAFIYAFQDRMARGHTRALRLCLAGFTALWLALIGLLIAFSLPVVQRQWPDIVIGQFSALTVDVLPAANLAFMPLFFVILSALVGTGPSAAKSTRAFAKALLGAVAARDTTVADVSATSASSIAQDDRQAGVTLASLAHPLGAMRENWAPFAIGAGPAFMALFVWDGHLILEPGIPESMGFNAWAIMLLGITLGLLAVIGGAIYWRFHYVLQGGFIATADDAGLTFWRARGRPHEQRILWSDARGLARFVYYDRSALPSYVYILDAAGERFIWEEPAIRSDASENARRLAWERREDARRLTALIERRANLPLFDVSRAINAAIGGRAPSANSYPWSVAERALSVARSSGDEALTRNLLARLRPAGPFSRMPRGLARLSIWWSARKLDDMERQKLLDLMRALLPYYSYPARPDAPVPQPLPPTRRFLSASWLTLRQAVLVGLLIVCLLPQAHDLVPPVLNPLYSHALETALPARVLSEQPLYFAALSAPTPGWATRAVGKTDPRSARFTLQGYELTASQSQQSLQNNIVWNPSLRMPVNGAIMVTVAVSPAVGGGSNSAAQVTEAGVLFDGSADGARGLLFEVDSEGDWRLRHCGHLNSPVLACSDILAMSDGFSFNNGPLAPRPGGASTFHLPLVRQGRTYLLYANGAFLAAYHDDAGPAAAGGMIGLYLDAFGQTARFTNLAVYPVPAGMPFWAW